MFSRMPPAVFPSIIGLLGLGLTLRYGAVVVGMPVGLAEALLGAVSVLWLFSFGAYLSKVIRRPAVLIEELRVLPGRAGLATMTLCALVFAMVLVPYSPGLAEVVAYIGLALHGALAVLMVLQIVARPEVMGGVTPVWHLNFVGFVIGGIAASLCGLPVLALVILCLTVPAATVIWAISLGQLLRNRPPAPLRPMLAIHLSPAALFAVLAMKLGMPDLAQGFVILGGAIFIALLLSVRWVTEAGFSALWGSFTFPLAAFSGALFAVGWNLPAIMVLMLALAVVPFVAIRVFKSWASGALAARTNAAQA
ncbi:MAG: tellurium resistance protein [Paracoccaceae bacterium]|nr:tellurium resistance protein [Paracoccaceae bacterium]